MSPRGRLIVIGLAAPALTFALGTLIWGVGFLAFAVLGYPIMAVITLACIFPLHRLFVVWKWNSFRQVPAVLLVSLACGVLVYVVLFFEGVFFRSVFSTRLALEYAAYGVAAGLCTWLLYNFGPLRVSRSAP